MSLASDLNKRSAVKKPWTPAEDQQLLNLVEIHGSVNWGLISDILGCRSGKQCRERYHNHLVPDIKKGDWTEEEDRIILEMQAKLGNQWAKITKMLPGRTDNAVKNRWHATMRSRNKTVSPADVSASSSPIGLASAGLNLSGLSSRGHPLVPQLSFDSFQQPTAPPQVSHAGTEPFDAMLMSYNHAHAHIDDSNSGPSVDLSNLQSVRLTTGRGWNNLSVRSPTAAGALVPNSFTFSARPDGLTFSARSTDGFTLTARSTDENLSDLRKFLEYWDSENAALSFRKFRGDDLSNRDGGVTARLMGSPNKQRTRMDVSDFESFFRRFDVSPRFDVDLYQGNKRRRVNAGGAADEAPAKETARPGNLTTRSNAPATARGSDKASSSSGTTGGSRNSSNSSSSSNSGMEPPMTRRREEASSSSSASNNS